jgi:hypothetical protein
MKYSGTLIAVVVMMRYVAAVESPDTSSSSTVIEMLVGTGSYADVSRDCNGKVLGVKDVPYSEYGGTVSHSTSMLKLGVSAGVSNAKRTAELLMLQSAAPSTFVYVAPQIGLNTKYVALDIGYLFDISSGSWSLQDYGYYRKNGTVVGALRGGRADKKYFYARYGMNTPISVGSGVIDLGIGFGSQDVRYEFGVGAVPDDGLIISAKGTIPVSGPFSLSFRGHIAPGEGFGYGVAAGARVHF